MDLQKIICSVSEHRDEIINRLLNFSATDTILYLRGAGCDQSILLLVQKAIDMVNNILNSNFEEVDGFVVSDINQKQKDILKKYLFDMDDQTLTILYFVALELKSVLLGILFVSRSLAVQDVFNLSFAEELEEQKKWGGDETIAKKHSEILENLKQWESFCYERSIFKN